MELDAKGREIRPGDLLRSFHFRHANRRHGINYLYHVVVEREGHLYMVPTSHLHDTTGGGDCPLKHRPKSAEIIDGYNPYWRERPMHKTLGIVQEIPADLAVLGHGAA